MDLLSRLETFVAIAEQGGVSRAADELDLPQPLVSRRLQSLERAWGAPLFERTPQFSLTAVGDLALPYARDVVQRVQYLQGAISNAQSRKVHLLGIPPGCAPGELAKMIAAAESSGSTIALHEDWAADRREGLSSGRLAAAVMRVDPRGEVGRVITGLARQRRPGGGDPRPVHLDSLRPRRAGSGLPAPTLLVTPEDDIEPFFSILLRVAARAGVAESGIRRVASPGVGAPEVLAGGHVLLCDAPTAAAAGLDWAPLADPGLHRGYELVAGSSGPGGISHELLEALAPHCAAAVGATTSAAESGPGSSSPHDDALPGDDADDRLAASGW